MHQISNDIALLFRCASQYRNERLAPMGLKSCHAIYLSQICDRPGISQDALVQRVHFDKSNVARQSAVLEEEGFITRCSCSEDKRVMRLYPTEKALALLPTIHAVLEDWEALLTQDLSEEEIRLLSSLLDRMKTRAVAWKEEN